LKTDVVPNGKPEYDINAAIETTDGAQLLKSLPAGDPARTNNNRQTPSGVQGTGGSPTKWKSEDYSLTTNDSFRYVWFKITALQSAGEHWAVLGELKVFEVKPPHTYDPETETETPL